jgi:hypothetical protein
VVPWEFHEGVAVVGQEQLKLPVRRGQVERVAPVVRQTEPEERRRVFAGQA